MAQLRTKMAGAKQRPPSLQSVPSRDAGASPRDSVLVPQTPIDTPNDAWLRDVAAEMSRHSTGVSVRDRTHLLTKYRKCFVGSRGVEWLLKHAFADDTESAIALGQEMLNKGLLEHVHNEQRYLNRNSAFYRFTVRRRQRRRQASLNVRLPDGMELKQRLETTEAMVDDLCDWVMNLTADAESMRECMVSLEAASRAQIGAAKRGMLAQLLVLAGGAVSYVLMVEAAGLNWSAALCTVCAVAVPLIWLAVDRFDRMEAKARRSSEVAQGSLVQTLSANRLTLGGKLDVSRTEAIESIAVQNLHQYTDDSSSSSSGSSGDDGSDSDSDSDSRVLERFSSAPDSLPPQNSSASAAKVMARRSLRRGIDNMAGQHQCWSSPPPDIFTVRSASYMADRRKEPGSRPLFELLRVDFAAIDTEHQSNIAAQRGTPVDLGLCAPNDAGSDSDDDSLGVRILERPDSQGFEPKYFGARFCVPISCST